MKLSLFLLLLFSAAVIQVTAQKRDSVLIFFDFNQSFITKKAATSLDSLLRGSTRPVIIKEIKLYGHCDSIGNDAYNDSLSLERVKAIKEYLMLRSIPDSVFLLLKAMGKRQPISKGKTIEARAMNRRVEMQIIKQFIVESPIDSSYKKEREIRKLDAIFRDSNTVTGSNILLRNVNFEGGRHKFLPTAYPLLQELLAVLEKETSLEIQIHGYICCLPDGRDGIDIDLGTYDLSVQRAKAVYLFLVNNGINTKRLSYQGRGSSNKLFPLELNEEQRSQNRRVEIKIIKK
jgi:outer membrane protein OmpA-like peptidoglycan-associated protein